MISRSIISLVLPSKVIAKKKLRVDPDSIVEMENRIKRLESVIAASGLNGQLSTESHSETEDTPPLDTTIVTDRLSTLLIDDEGSSSFLGKFWARVLFQIEC